LRSIYSREGLQPSFCARDVIIPAPPSQPSAGRTARASITSAYRSEEQLIYHGGVWGTTSSAHKVQVARERDSKDNTDPASIGVMVYAVLLKFPIRLPSPFTSSKSKHATPLILRLPGEEIARHREYEHPRARRTR
jgi:hypothetical protein